jgi:hypothetical protein
MKTKLEIKSVRLVLYFNPYDTVKQLINKRSQIETCFFYMCFTLFPFMQNYTFQFQLFGDFICDRSEVGKN